MRHNKTINHLGRQASHRKAMMANMTCSLILHKRIKTTLAKAKALQKYAEPLITKGKTDTTHSRRTVFSYLKQKEATAMLFGIVAEKIGDRPGGYTRILKTGFRQGDAAEMCFIELVDFNDTYVNDKKSTATAAKRTRRAGAAKKVEEVETKVKEVATKAKSSVKEETKEVEAKVEEIVAKDQE